MNEENKFSELTNEELQSKYETSKKLYYPVIVLLFAIFTWGVYAGAKGKMGFFLIVLFMFASITCLKYIEKNGKLKKEMKSRNLLK